MSREFDNLSNEQIAKFLEKTLGDHQDCELARNVNSIEDLWLLAEISLCD